jgi:hypothetical protein
MPRLADVDTYDKVEWNLQHRTRFLDDNEYDYGATPPMYFKMEDKEKPLAIERELLFDQEILGEEVWNDTNDCLGYLLLGKESQRRGHGGLAPPHADWPGRDGGIQARHQGLRARGRVQVVGPWSIISI